MAGSVVLHAQASSSSPRRVLNINPGSSGVVQVIGLNITRGYIMGHGSDNSGGGVNIYSGTVTISSCTISGNSADNGGGIYVSSGTVTITSSLISGNTAYFVRAHSQNFPSPQWETHVLLVACRAVVSQSLEAQ